MIFLGDNARFGAERVELTPERLVDPVVGPDEEPLPFGTEGLVPIVTERRKKGGCKTVYGFPFAEGEAPTDSPLAQELEGAVGFVNQLLVEAAERSGHGFGTIGAIWIGIPDRGYNFTRVEQAPDNDHDGAPYHLRIETSDQPKEPDTLSVVLEYDFNGYVRHALMVEYGENGTSCRAMAGVDFDDGAVHVRRVIQVNENGSETTLYWGF